MHIYIQTWVHAGAYLREEVVLDLVLQSPAEPVDEGLGQPVAPDDVASRRHLRVHTSFQLACLSVCKSVCLSVVRLCVFIRYA